MNKNVTYPKEIRCPACHVACDSDVEYWMQDYNFPSWFMDQCNNPKCEKFCGDFKVNLEIAIRVTGGWIPVTDRLPEDGQECWTYRPENTVAHFAKAKVGTHEFWNSWRDYGGPWWKGFGPGNTNHKLDWNEITHWQPLERPEAPEVDK